MEEGEDRWVRRVPRKRFRDRRRYYRRLARLAAEVAADLDWDGWFDLWHTHADWRGHGNLGGRDRQLHLAASLDLLRVFRERAGMRTEPAQVFAFILPLDSSDDGVYVHTPNPNHDNFPNDFEGVAWDVPAPPILRDLLAGDDWQLGRFPGDDVWPVHYIVRPRQPRDTTESEDG